MQRLKNTDGAVVYDRDLTHTIRSTSRYPATQPIGARLVAPREKLRQADAEVALALRAQTEATADLQLTDADDDDLVREIKGEAKKLDRRDPTLGLQDAVFRDGLKAVVSRSGEAQVTRLKQLRDRLDGVCGRAPEFVAQYRSRIDETIARGREMAKAQKHALDATARARTALELVKAQIREEMETAYADLRKLFRSNPMRAERFFTSNKRTREKLGETDEKAA